MTTKINCSSCNLSTDLYITHKDIKYQTTENISLTKKINDTNGVYYHIVEGNIISSHCAMGMFQEFANLMHKGDEVKFKLSKNIIRQFTNPQSPSAICVFDENEYILHNKEEDITELYCKSTSNPVSCDFKTQLIEFRKSNLEKEISIGMSVGKYIIKEKLAEFNKKTDAIIVIDKV